LKGALIAAAATGVQVGTALVASEAVVAEVGSGRLGFLRYAIGLAVLLPVALMSRSPAMRGRDWLPVALIGIGQFGILIALLNIAVLYTSSSRVALVFATLPLLTLAVGGLINRCLPARRDIAAILLTLVGIAVLLGGDALAGSLAARDMLGLAAAFGATLVGAVCSSFYRPYLERYGVVKVSAIAMAASLLPLGLMSLLENPAVPPWDWHGTTIALIVFIGLASGVGYLAWLYALSATDAGIVTAFLALSPITAALLSAIFFSAPITPALGLALVLVVAGLLVMARARKTPIP
jgi:drug/metabolite transporter (DMT)-like permease